MTQKTSKSDSVQISSNEVFDHICQICADRGEKEAVGFCTSCDMYMCQKCCQQHKKIPVTICHNVLGKEQFGDSDRANGLFVKRLMPMFQVQYPAKCRKLSKETEDNLKNYTKCELCHILNVPSSDSMLLFLYQNNNVTKSCVYEIGNICSSGRYFNIISGDIKEGFERNSKCLRCKSVTYITIPKTNMVIKYCNEHQQTHHGFTLTAGRFCNAITVNIDIGFDLPNWTIQHVQLNGTTITEFYYCEDGKPLFEAEPKYLASNHLQDVLFIATDGSTTNSSLVLAVDKKGTVIFKYAIGDLGNPCGLTCDTDGNIYISTKEKIIQIDKHGKKNRDLLKANKEINFRNIHFNMESQQLVVVDSSHKITKFKFV